MKLGTNHSWVKGILDCSNKGPDPLQMGDNHKIAKMGCGHPNHWARIGHIYMKAFWYNIDSELFKPWSMGVRRGHNREKIFGSHNFCGSVEKGKQTRFYFKPESHWTIIAQIYIKAFWHSADLSLYKLWSLRVKLGDTRGETIFTFVYW
jgi:hypothetical protein